LTDDMDAAYKNGCLNMFYCIVLFIRLSVFLYLKLIE